MKQNSRNFINPFQIVSQLDIRPGSKVADFGCGHGYFSLAFADAAGEDGVVFALDILPSSLEAVQSSAKLSNIYNIKTQRCDLEIPGGSGVDDNSVDLVFIANILYQSQKKEKIIKEAKRILKVGGQLAVVEWHPSKKISGGGWPIEKEELEKMIMKIGFNFVKYFEVGDYHYVLIFNKE